MKRFLLGLLLSISALAQTNGARVLTGSAQPPLPFNVVPNSTFEDRTTGWFATSGTFTATDVFANVARGKWSASWTVPASTSGGVLLQTASLVIPAGLYNATCVGYIMYKGSAVTNGAMVLEAYDGATALGTKAFSNNSTYARLQTDVFACPTSGSIRLRIRTTATSPAAPTAVYFDEAFLGDYASIGGSGGGQLAVIPTVSLTAGATLDTGADVRSVVYVVGSGGAVTLDSAAPILDGNSDAQERIIYGTSDTSTVTVPVGTNMLMNGPVTLTSSASLGLIWDSSVSKWRENYRRQ